MRRLKGKDSQTVQMILDVLLDGAVPTREQIDVRLAMLVHNEDIADDERALELLDGPVEVYLAYIQPVLDTLRNGPEAKDNADGSVTLTLAHPEPGLETVTVRPLKGRDWRLALSERQELNRLSAMTGLPQDALSRMDFADYNGIAAASLPFVQSVWGALMDGGLLSPTSSEEAQTSPV